MDVTTALVGLLVGLLTLYLISCFLSNRGLPPFPSFPLPIIGHLHVMDPKFSREKMEAWREKLGDIFSFKVGPSLIVVINGYDNIRDAFVKRADDLSGRPSLYVDWAVGLENLGIIGNDGPNWKEQRSVSLSILRNMGMGKNVLADVITEESKEFLSNIGKAEGKPQDIRHLTAVSISNVICSIVVGQRFQYDDPTFKRMLEIINYNLERLVSLEMTILNVWPIFHYIPGDIFNVNQINKNREEFGRLFVKHFRELKGGKEYDENNMDSYIANYVREQNNREAKGQTTSLNERNLFKNIEDLVSAGTDTTTATIMWFVMFMLHYPEIQEKIFQEINENIGTEKPPTMVDKNRLNYVNAAILETQRLGNIAHIGVMHRASRDTTFKGFRIPKDTQIISYLTSVMFDEKLWGEDVDSFRPERFLDESGNLKHFEEHIPFSTGRRTCPGEALAKMELFMYITSMCQRFKFLPPIPDNPPKIEEVLGIVRQPGPYEVRAIDRHL